MDCFVALLLAMTTLMLQQDEGHGVSTGLTSSLRGAAGDAALHLRLAAI
jgi:hypothetical protein